MASQEIPHVNAESQVLSGSDAVVDPESHNTQLQSKENAEPPFQRPIGKWRWFAVCIGWTLGALLYGMVALFMC